VEEQMLHWSSLGIAFVLGLTVLVAKRQTRRERRSWSQWMILRLYMAAWRFWVMVRAVDVGYLEYRRAIGDTPFEIENERFLGKLIKPSRARAAAARAA
jgi:hypothetical protein